MGETVDEFRIDFVGVGAFRSGTTWTAQCLDEHPQVCIGLRKELNYFCSRHTMRNFPINDGYYVSTHFDGGIEWLKSRFEHAEPGQLLGEFSPTYLDDPESPRLLHEHNPDMKLIFNLRNPIDSLYSNYTRARNFLDVGDTFEIFLERYPEVMEYRFYYRHIQRFLEQFPPEQLHYIMVEDIFRTPDETYRSLCNFLGIDADFLPRA